MDPAGDAGAERVELVGPSDAERRRRVRIARKPRNREVRPDLHARRRRRWDGPRRDVLWRLRDGRRTAPRGRRRWNGWATRRGRSPRRGRWRRRGLQPARRWRRRRRRARGRWGSRDGWGRAARSLVTSRHGVGTRHLGLERFQNAVIAPDSGRLVRQIVLGRIHAPSSTRATMRPPCQRPGRGSRGGADDSRLDSPDVAASTGPASDRRVLSVVAAAIDASVVDVA